MQRSIIFQVCLLVATTYFCSAIPYQHSVVIKINPGAVNPWNCGTIICLEVLDPVCGTDGVTYSNDCYLKRATCNSHGAIQLLHKGACCNYNCALNVKLVCGSDGYTYPNECILNLVACLLNNGLHKAYDGQCTPIINIPGSGGTLDLCPGCAVDPVAHLGDPVVTTADQPSNDGPGGIVTIPTDFLETFTVNTENPVDPAGGDPSDLLETFTVNTENPVDPTGGLGEVTMSEIIA
jgi:hypothetical protein